MLNQQTKTEVKTKQDSEFQNSKKLLQLAKHAHEQYLLKQQQIIGQLMQNQKILYMKLVFPII